MDDNNVPSPLPNGEQDSQSPSKLQIGVSFHDFRCYRSVAPETHHDSSPNRSSPFPTWTRPKQKVQLLHNVQGVILPGEMLLVLGQPGSGCSTFLKSLSGDASDFTIENSQNINYQGTPYERFHKTFKGERVYLAELDVHFPELTLGQTLDFAASTRRPDYDPSTARDAAQTFDLGGALDTKVGNELIRGISGGEKRRLSIAEATISGAQLQLWDNSTRGLDSSTAFRLIQHLRHSTQTRQSTVAMTLYQASERMYEQFDTVMLLYEGHQICFGPIALASDYFHRLGFERPSHVTTPDFLTSITHPAERIVRKGFEGSVPLFPGQFAQVWRDSEEAAQLRTRVDEFNAAHPIHEGNASSGDPEKAYGALRPSSAPSTFPLSILQQTGICTTRAFLRLRLSMDSAISGIVANSILGIIIGSVFYNLSETADGLQRRSLVLFFAVIVNSFVPGPESVLMWAQRPIVQKHRRYAFYHPFTERLASLVSDLPMKIAVCFGIHLPLYFMANLRRSASAFFTDWLFMFVNIIVMSLFFRMIGSVSRTHEQTTTPVSVIVLFCIIYSGFVVPPRYMVDWFGWFWRINPLAYTYESLVINEMRDRLFPCPTMIPGGPSYESTGENEKICASFAGGVGQQQVQGTTYMSVTYGYSGDQLWRNFGVLLAMLVIFLVIYLLASEYFVGQATVKRAPARSLGEPKKDLVPEEVKSSDTSKESSESTGPIALVPAQSQVFHWANLSYEIKTKKQHRVILSNIDGWVTAGTLTALMGVTGAGKTSLLNALAGWTMTGTVSGDILINGLKRNHSFQRKLGYVQQDDIHLPTSTVREALQFSALLRQPQDVPHEEKVNYVEYIMDMMDMQWFADVLVGEAGGNLNVEQRKRLTIAVEMAAKPEVLLFLDEPTSGLDSQSAWSICMLLKRLAHHGQTILCTIHQPSSQLFQMFDRLLLLGNNGKTLYFGDIGNEASTMIRYFESNGASACLAGVNPAEWMLDVTGVKPKTEDPDGDDSSPAECWSEKWISSEERQEVRDHLTSLAELPSRTAISVQEGTNDEEFAASLPRQMIVVSKRIFLNQWRDSTYLFNKIVLSISLAFVNGMSFYNAALDMQGIINLLFSIFLITHLFSCIDFLVIPHFIKGRALFEGRERHSRSYSWVVFIASNVLMELVWQTIIAVPIFVVWYYPLRLYQYSNDRLGTTERGALSFVFIWLFNLWASTLSQAFAASIEYSEVAMQIATLIYWLAILFCGILTPPSQLARFWIFMYRVSPLTYLLEGLAVAGLADIDLTCSSTEVQSIPVAESSPGLTCGEYLSAFVRDSGGRVLNPSDEAECHYCPVASVNTILESYGMGLDHTWRNVGLLVVYVVVNILATFGFYWLRLSSKKKSGGA
ncbi:unnamed protein product [Clonostachys rosea]|uniref:ABC transporter domain-containing protein n=1 Tax=Bionectria ochroleuca TaxID=29856 RepID=A0ABY6U3M9_BIOOC|nr:unnamed protein product [Clonostachys rosea]